MSIASLRPRVPMSVSSYDRCMAALTALIAIKGSIALGMFIVWMSGPTDSLLPPPPRPLPPPELPTTNVAPDDQDLIPDVVEFPELQVDSMLKNEIEAVTDLVSTVLVERENSLGNGTDPRIGGGDPQYRPQRGGQSANKWRIDFSVDDFDEYKRIIDQFGIELGIVHSKQDSIRRVSNVSGVSRVAASNRQREAKSVHFSNRTPLLRGWDVRIAKDAVGDLEENPVLVLFYPPELVAHLEQLEANYLSQVDRKLKNVQRTSFRIESDGEDYQFVVDKCEYRY